MNMNIVTETILQPSLAVSSKKVDTNNSQVSETVVIQDECGDTLWDAVLEQAV